MELGTDFITWLKSNFSWLFAQAQTNATLGQSYGEQKVLRLTAWIEARFGLGSASAVTLYAYGDTAGDKPMLRMAGQAWYRGKVWSSKLP